MMVFLVSVQRTNTKKMHNSVGFLKTDILQKQVSISLKLTLFNSVGFTKTDTIKQCRLPLNRHFFKKLNPPRASHLPAKQYWLLLNRHFFKKLNPPRASHLPASLFLIYFSIFIFFSSLSFCLHRTISFRLSQLVVSKERKKKDKKLQNSTLHCSIPYDSRLHRTFPLPVVRALYFTKEIVVGPQGFVSFSKKERFAFTLPCCIWYPSHSWKGLFFPYSIWSPSPSYQRREKHRPCLLYKGQCQPQVAIRAKQIIFAFVFWGVVCQQLREKVRTRKRVIFPFCFYSPLGKVRIGCNWGFGFEWFSHPVTFLYSSFDSGFSLSHFRQWI